MVQNRRQSFVKLSCVISLTVIHHKRAIVGNNIFDRILSFKKRTFCDDCSIFSCDCDLDLATKRGVMRRIWNVLRGSRITLPVGVKLSRPVCRPLPQSPLYLSLSQTEHCLSRLSFSNQIHNLGAFSSPCVLFKCKPSLPNSRHFYDENTPAWRNKSLPHLCSF